MTDSDTAVSGEARLKARRTAFFRYAGLLLLGGFAAGFASGVTGILVQDGLLPPSVLYALWAVLIGLCAWMTRDYFRRIDELDLLDNLWASTIGLYSYMVIFGTWYVFHDVGLIGPVNQIAVFVATIAIVCLAYGARKLGWR